MTPSRPSRGLRAAAILGAAAVLAACTSGSTAPPDASRAPSASATPPPAPAVTAAPSPELARYYRQQPRWEACGGGFRCADITVPIDYAHPAGGNLTLAAIRLPASDQEHRRGSLLLDPGGPGVSAVDYAQSANQVTSSALRRVYDIVGVDPRGVGESTPVTCRDTQQLNADLALDQTPDSPAEEQALVADARRLGQLCLHATGRSILSHVSTVDAARDLDVVRAVLGDRRLNYLGASYGTLLGATYAALFPDRVGRLVLDGAMDPKLSTDEISAAQAVGFDRNLRAFLADCVQHSDCPFHGTVDEAITRIQQLLRKIDGHPLPAQDTRRTVSEQQATFGIASLLYSEQDRTYLRQALSDALHGDGTLLLAASDSYANRDDDGYDDNSNDAIYAVNCLDRRPPGGAAEARKRSSELAAEAPVFGPALAWSDLPCQTWPVHAAEPLPTSAPVTPPILVVGTTNDPATPYTWSQRLAGDLASGVLLTRKGDGHTAYLVGNPCIDAAVDGYLVSGTVPAAGTTC